MRLLRVTAPAALLAVLALSACGPGTPTAGDTETPKPVETVTPSATPTPEPVALTCENIVSPATIAGFTSDDIGITPPAEFSAKLHDEGSELAVFFDAGGILCQTGRGSGAYEIYGYAVLSEAQFAPIRSQWLTPGPDGGRIETIGDVGATYEIPGDQEGLPRICYVQIDVFTVCGNDGDRIDEIVDTLALR
jgi:hypothetical protein